MNETRRDFLNDCAHRFAAGSLGTFKHGMDALGRFLPQSFDDVADWSRENVDEYRNWLSATYDAPITAAMYGEFVLGHFLRFLGHSALFAEIKRVYRTRTHNNTELGFPDEPLEAMIQLIPLDKATNVRNRLILELLLKTGPKVTELIRVCLQDVDFKEGEITYRRNDKARPVQFDAVLADLLQYYIHCWRPELESESANEHLLLTKRGDSLDRTTIWRVVKKHFSDLGDEICPKEIRNEFIGRLLRDGESRNLVIGLAGLSHVSQTYVHELGRFRGGAGSHAK